MEDVQPLLLLSIDSRRLLSASPLPPLLFRPLLMNTLLTCVFLVRSDVVAGDGRRHGECDATVTGAGDAALAAAAAGWGLGRLREVMTLIMTFFAAETVLPFRSRPSVLCSSFVFSIRPLHHHHHHPAHHGTRRGCAAVA